MQYGITNILIKVGLTKCQALCEHRMAQPFHYYMTKHFFTLILICISCSTICNAQTLLPINGYSISLSPTGAIDLEFTESDQSFLLSDIISWNEGDSYTIYFREPVSSSDIRIGNDMIPKGVTSFKGFNPPNKHFHRIASNGEKFEDSYAWMKIISGSPTKLHISEVIINRKDGSKFRANYPNPRSNCQYTSKYIHWEAKNGEEYEQFLEATAQLYKATILSGKVTFTGSNSYIGGAEWVGSNGGRLQYRLKLYSPTTSDNFAWKYVTKSGESRHQKIEKNTSFNTLIIDEEITECYIVPLIYKNGEYLDIQEISVQDGSQPIIETLVLWHANGTTTEISLYKKPRITFSADKILIQGTGVNFEYPLEDIVRFTYKKEDIINEINAPTNQTNFTHDDERIVFNGIKSADEVALYKLNGTRVAIQLNKVDDNYVLPLNSISKGMYLLHINGKTFKIIKK